MYLQIYGRATLRSGAECAKADCETVLMDGARPLTKQMGVVKVCSIKCFQRCEPEVNRCHLLFDTATSVQERIDALLA
jgi:hypothetical protein